MSAPSAPEPLPADLFPELTDRQRAAIPVVLAGPTVGAGLAAAEVSRSTWYRWGQTAAVRQVVLHLQRESLRESLGDLHGGTRYAVTGLLGVMTSKNENVKLQACRDVLSFAMRGAELLDLEDRMSGLEAALQPLLDDARL